MVAIIKNSLLSTFRGKNLSETALRTAPAEIAGVLNSRPLIYVSEELGDNPLSLNHFLHAHYTSLIDIKKNSQTPTAANFVTIWKEANKTAKLFWSTWVNSYLQHIRNQYHRYHFPQAINRFEPTIDTVVFIEETNIKHLNCKLGKIINFRHSDDSKVRAVDFKLENGSIITRPQSQLYPLKLPVQDSPEVQQPEVPVDENVEVETVEIAYN